MSLLINYEPINILLTILGSGIFAGSSAAVYKIIIGYFQKDKDKEFSVKIDKDGQTEVNLKGYSMRDVKALLEESSVKTIIKESARPTLKLINTGKSK